MKISKREKLVAKLTTKKDAFITKMKGAKPVKKTITTATVVLACLLFAGCATQPSRSQTQTFEDCQIYVMVPPSGTATGATVCAAGDMGDLFAQNMMIENSGTETTSPQHTVSPQTQIDVPIGTGGGASWGSLFGGLASLFGVKSATADGQADTAKAAAAADCADGSCTKTQ